MVRVLLLLEDYNELLFTETILKKVGFDVESSKNHLNLVETLLGFNPEVLVVPGSGRRILLSEVLQQVRKQRRQPHIFIIGGTASNDDQVATTTTLSHPLNPKELLEALAAFGGMDAEVLLDKYRRAQAEAKEIAHVQSAASIDSFRKPEKKPEAKNEEAIKIQLQPTTMSAEVRAERFSKALEQVTPSKISTFDQGRVKAEKKNIRMNENQDAESIKLENERKEFLKTLAEVTPASLKKMN